MTKIERETHTEIKNDRAFYIKKNNWYNAKKKKKKKKGVRHPCWPHVNMTRCMEAAAAIQSVLTADRRMHCCVRPMERKRQRDGARERGQREIEIWTQRWRENENERTREREMERDTERERDGERQRERERERESERARERWRD